MEQFDGIISDSHAQTEGQAPESGEGQAQPKGPVFTALEEVIDGDLEDGDESTEEETEENDPELEKQEEGANPEVANPEPDKKVQTPEENAHYAELRRQQEAAQRQAEMQRQLDMMRQQMPETQIAQILSQQYGVTPQEMLYRLRENQLEQEAEQLGVTPQQLRYQRQQEEAIRQQQEAMAQQQQYMQMQGVLTRLQREGMEVQQKYPMLTPDDLTEAVIFGYEHQSLHLPLEHLVRAKHAEKLYAADQQAARQQALAQVSGRMGQNIIPPTGKAPTTTTLTEAERFYARKFGMSDEEYAKWK
jgi:hypothetical protein